MHSQSQGRFMATITVIAGVMAILLGIAWAGDPCFVQHPIKPPDKSFSGRCNNCGMGRAMWARTWKTFENSKGGHEVCSFTCLAKYTVKNGENPATVKTSLYQDPNTMVAAENAIFVVGSKAKGTMTKTSKLAFGSQKEAGEFVRTCGGKAMGFQQTFELAQKGQKK
jgi:hypothetical protein